MAFVIKFAKGVRNHWKKSTFAALAIAYGVNYAIDRNEANNLMRLYCEKAAEYGKQPLPNNSLPRSVTVILNPNANKRKATKNFEKYCAPILNLAGICVDIVQTESEGHAKTLMETLPTTDAVVVAGGDGTLSEVITGLLRTNSEDKNKLLPIGVLPLGRSNVTAKNLFPGGDYLEDVRSLADASLAVVEEMTKPIDVMRIEVMEEEAAGKPVYAVSGIEWGAYRDAQVKKDSYWYFGALRNYATYIFNGYKNSLTWNCEGTLKYSEPCEGCKNCFVERKSPVVRRWYHTFLSSKGDKSGAELVNNEKCNETTETHISTADLSIFTSNALSDSLEGPPSLTIKMGPPPEKVDYFNFVSQGWRNEQGQSREVTNTIAVRQVELQPLKPSEEGKETFFSIDKEDFEVKPVKITLLPRFINMFCKKSVI